jgi:outer membrane protein assembly factor BamB
MSCLHSRWKGAAITIAVMLLGTANFASRAVPAGTQGALWTVRLESRIRWQRVTSVDLSLVQTEKGIHGIRGFDGSQEWELPGLVVERSDVSEIGGLLILNVRNKQNARDPRTMAVETVTGTVRWENESIPGRSLALGPLPEPGRMLLVNSREISKSQLSTIGGGQLRLSVKPRLYAVDINTGRVEWEQVYPRPVDLFKDTSTFGTTQFTIAGLPDPIVTEEALVIPWSGLTKYRARDGKREWMTKYHTTNDRTRDVYGMNAFTIVDNIAYTTGVGVVRAVDLRNGRTLWSVKGLGQAVPQLFIEEARVYAKTGGVFYDSGKSKYTGLGKNGFAALDRRSGKVLWKYTSAEADTTNAVRWGNALLFADARNVYGVGLTGIELFRYPLHFGADSPWLAEIDGNDLLVLKSDHHRTAFDLRERVQRYDIDILKPEVAPWRRVVAVGVRAAVRVGTRVALPAAGQILSDPINRLAAIATGRLSMPLAQKLHAAPSQERFDIFLSSAEEDKTSTRIVRLDKTTGETTTLAQYGRRDVMTEVDMTFGRVYSAEGNMLAAHRVFDAPGTER